MNIDLEDCDERRKFISDFWQYYLMLEKDCVLLRRYIDFRKTNMSTCSDEIIKQFLSVSAEFDSLCKKVTNTRDDYPTILDYAKWFFSDNNDTNIKKILITLKNSDIELRPFSSWGKGKNNIMPWWNAYNLVKHHRNEEYLLGNLDNLLNALAALYFLECYQFKKISEQNSKDGRTIFDVPPDVSDLFYIKNFDTLAFTVGHELIGVAK